MGEGRISGMAAATLAARTYLDGERKNRPLSSSIVRGTVYTAPSAEEHARLYQQAAKTFYQRFGTRAKRNLSRRSQRSRGPNRRSYSLAGWPRSAPRFWLTCRGGLT